MRNTPPNNTPRSTETRFSPPAFPPKAGKAVHFVQVSKRAIWDVVVGIYILAQIFFVPLAIIFFFGGAMYLVDSLIFDYDYNDERSNRNIVLEDSVFLLVDENRSEIASADLLPGDRITFMHTGNITEVVHSSTSCSSSSSGVPDWDDSGSDSYYGGDNEMECWTNYYTHFVLNASSFMFESSSVNDIYMCHRSTCKVTGELVNSHDFLIDIRLVEVIS